MNDLYNISAEIEEFFEAVDAGDIPQDCIKDTFEGLKGELEDKVNDVIKQAKYYKRKMEGISAEIKDLQGAKARCEDGIESCKALIGYALNTLKDNKLKTDRYSCWMQTSESVEISEEYPIEDIPSEYLTYEVPKISKSKCKEAIDQGIDLPFAHINKKKSARWR